MPGQIPGEGNVFLIDGSGVPVSATNVTGIVTLASFVVPGRVMGPNGCLRVSALWTVTNSANAKNCRILWGGNIVLLRGNGNVATEQNGVIIRNRNSLASQACFNGAMFSSGPNAVIQTTVNTENDAIVAFQCDMAALAETVTLEAYSIEVMRC